MRGRFPDEASRHDEVIRATQPGGSRVEAVAKKTVRLGCLSVLSLAVLVLFAAQSAPSHATPFADAKINEFVCNHTGTDVFEYVEVFGTPVSDYSMLTILEIDGDGTVAGYVKGVFPVGTTDGAGFWTTGFLNGMIENGSLTLLLGLNFTGSMGDDLDLDNDGILDVTPFDLVVDDVAVWDGGSNDRLYSATILSEGFDGIPYEPGGASRIPNGVDTDTVSDWMRNDFDGAGLPLPGPGTPSVGEALNTPGSINEPVTPAGDPVVNEFVANHVDVDTLEFVEIFGDPDADYSRFTILEVEGDGSNSGRIDAALRVGTTDADGFWVTDFLSGVVENGSMTLLLVENFTGYVGQDLDADNDGVMDWMPFGRIVDDVAVLNGGVSDWVYSSVVLVAGFDGNPFLPGGASRIPNGIDTDGVSDWLRNDYDGEGLPGFTGSPVYGEAFNTPGAMNEPVADTTPPVIVVDLNRTVLWPPNHKMAEICATVTVTDNADPMPTFVLSSVTSSEPDNGKGDGNTVNDIQGADIGNPDVCFYLRAERRGGGPGREYTIVYTATDASGNSASMTLAVRVPHDHSGWAMASSGFLPDGTALDEAFDRFAVVIPSQVGSVMRDEDGNFVIVRDGYDATEIDVHHVYLGNGCGAVRPIDSVDHDVNGDGLVDLAVFYSVADALALQAATEAYSEPEGKIEKKISGGPIGVHYETADGTEYLVANIFELGTAVRLLVTSPLTVPGSREGDKDGTPGAAARVSIHPNPFNPSTMISVDLSNGETAAVRVFDVQGRLVRTLKNGWLGIGRHDIEWDGCDSRGRRVANGIYFVRVESAGFHCTRKAVVLK